ncbi:Flp pilus assembly protein CpaB [uncultured Serinicoccus sp.]|uniref:Flp pilus assembly protein CpaB n=1 Tax=uncultured Serinicoccus sp. TaxID=735514 RepID=UPI002638651D|nr:SAF domain-containing protein [uncultured Serinicoccus sp.]
MRRVIAAVLAIVLAALGIVLVLRYAQNADQRALEGMETRRVFVATEPIPEGTPAGELAGLTEARQVPEAYLIGGVITDLDDLEGEVALAEVPEGEQLSATRFATPDEIRGRDDFELPEEAQDLHQITVPLGTARSLGGDIAPGDTVGVFMSFDAEFQQGLYVDADGEVRWLEDLPQEARPETTDESGTESLNIALTQLALEKVLVTRVQGGYVPAPAPASTEAEEDAGAAEEEAGPEDEILVTMALSGGDAERLVYAMEFGTVWLSYEPETAEEDDTDVKVVQLPERAGGLLQ